VKALPEMAGLFVECIFVISSRLYLIFYPVTLFGLPKIRYISEPSGTKITTRTQTTLVLLSLKSDRAISTIQNKGIRNTRVSRINSGVPILRNSNKFIIIN
jgi:hypothetical protein